MRLIAAGTPLSDDPDLEAPVAANSNPNEAAPAANPIAVHPVTGTFADPTHERAFAAQLFRMAYPFHAFLMALMLAAYIWIALTSSWEVQKLYVPVALLIALGLIGRVHLHRMADSVRGQQLGSWTWAATITFDCVLNIGGFIFAKVATCAVARGLYSAGLYPLMVLAVALTNGSHGMGFAHKFALVLPVLAVNILKFNKCDDKHALAEALGEFGMLVAGFVAAHMAELYMRHLYAAHTAEVEEDKQRLEGDKRRVEERNEQLQAEKERLLYDVQRRGRPIDDDNRSAIRRGLLAGPSQNPPTSNMDPSEAGGPAPSDSLPPSLPPGPPSSNSSGSVAPPLGSARSSRSNVVPLSWVEADRQWHAENPGWARSAENVAGAATLVAPTSSDAESICSEELEQTLAEMVTESEGTAAAGTVHERTILRTNAAHPHTLPPPAPSPHQPNIYPCPLC